jgi:glutamate-1-semialdehyde 2,1-aminomutase
MNQINTSSVDAAIRAEASRYIAGGVVSLNRKVDPHIVFKSAKGSRMTDVNGKEYIDYHAAFAPYLLGHNNDQVNNAVKQVIDGESSLYGSGTNELEVKLAHLLCSLVPSLELVQITNTGSEATAHAIRLSRAFTGRDHIILTLGGYNGWHNDVSRAVTPSLTAVGHRRLGSEYPFIPLSAGIPEAVKSLVHVVGFNDLEAISNVMKQYPVACVLTEPVMQNVGVVHPKPGYLEGLISLCEEHGSVCVFDEVKTGFRSALGGYQSVANVKPHLTVFGKAVANGYPLGVIGGRRDIMEQFDAADPQKRVLIAGTYNAHPVNAAAAIATLELLMKKDIHESIARVCDVLYKGLEQLFFEKGVPYHLSRNASAFCLYLMDHAPVDLHDILEHHDAGLDVKLRRAWIKNGVYHIPIPFKQGSVSYAHSMRDIEETLDITRRLIEDL